MRTQLVLRIFLVLFLAPTLVWAEQRTGFVVNWTSQKVLVVIVSEIGGAYEPLVFKLEAVESMGKGKYAYSGESVHVFRGKASTCSEDNRPGVPEKTVQSHRSVATLGFPIFQSSYSLSSLNVVFSWILPLG
jgi:hypothetical protein